MYGVLLMIFKVLSDLLTAASGVFGLLTEFKDKNKNITTSGKVALGGIVIGFLLSGAMAFLQAWNEQQEKKEHEQEVSRLGRPLDDHMHAWIVLSVPKDANGAGRYRPQLVAYFKNLMANHVKPDPSIPIFATAPSSGELKSFITTYGHLPAKFRARDYDITDIFDRSIEYSIQLFRSASCESLASRKTKPDLELGFDNVTLENDPSVTWEYVANNDFLAMSRNLKLWVAHSTSRFTSIEDFPGSTIVVWLGTADSHFTLEFLEINLRGVSFRAGNFVRIPGGGGPQLELPENAAKLGGRRFQGYCYEIPREAGE
jgi:hypothetical protein